MFVTKHPTDLTVGNFISWIFIDVTSHLASSSLGPVLTWYIVCDSSDIFVFAGVIEIITYLGSVA